LVSAPTRLVTKFTCQVEAVNPLVQMILGQPGMAARLISEHADDGNGRCTGCPLGGQRGHHSWPCTLRQAAEEAEKREQARTR
jgi:hypothetical protein